MSAGTPPWRGLPIHKHCLDELVLRLSRPYYDIRSKTKLLRHASMWRHTSVYIDEFRTSATSALAYFPAVSELRLQCYF